jgi:hypothetical protein
MSAGEGDKIRIVDGDWEVYKVLYFDLDEKVDDIERFIVQIKHINECGEEINNNVVAFVYPDGGCTFPDKTPDEHMVPIEGKILELSKKAVILACCKLGIYIDVVMTSVRMNERAKIIAERNAE